MSTPTRSPISARCAGSRAAGKRGQVAIAAGQAAPDADRLVLTETRGHTEYGICSTAFLEHAFRTDSYRIEVTFNPDGSWHYATDTVLKVRAQPTPFAHRDENTLVRVGEAMPNPLARILASKREISREAVPNQPK